MGSINKVFVLGYLGSDPEVKHTQSGDSVCNFSVATSEKWTDKSGKAQERTEWHRIVVWRKLADLCAQYLRKGSQVHLEGKIQTRKRVDKEGVERYTAEIVAEQVTFLGKADGDRDSKRYNQKSDAKEVDPDDDIPF